MEWIILFAVNWILLILLVRPKELQVTIWGGLVAIVLQLAVDTQAVNQGYYTINNSIISILGSSLFFIAGPVFVIGVLLAQYHPKSRLFTVLNVLVLTALYSWQEALLLAAGALEYASWNYASSIMVNLCALIVLSWFSVVILQREERYLT